MKYTCLIIALLFCLKLQAQSKQSILVHYMDACDTSVFDVSFEGVGGVWLKKQPKMPGKYIVKFCHPPYNTIMEFELNSHGEFCGRMKKYAWYGKPQEITADVDNGKCD